MHRQPKLTVCICFDIIGTVLIPSGRNAVPVLYNKEVPKPKHIGAVNIRLEFSIWREKIKQFAGPGIQIVFS